MYVNNRHNELIFCYLMSVYGDSWGICVKLSKVYLPVEYFTDSCRSVAKLCPTLCDPINCSMPGFPVLQTPFKLPEFAQTQVHWINEWMIERAFWQVLILSRVFTASPWLRRKPLPTDVALANEMSSFHSQEEIRGNRRVVQSFLCYSCHKPGTSQGCSAFSFQKLLLQQSWGQCMKELCNVEMRNHLLE